MTTSFSHPGCYASALNDCSRKLSREHYVSAAVLRLLGDDHTITNASWLRPRQPSTLMPTSALASKILCQDHNSRLSPLDACAEEFLTEFLWGVSDMRPDVECRRSTVDGDLIERWLLKVCCGAFVSGSLLEDGHPMRRQPTAMALNLLFGDDCWEEGCGLHLRQATLTPHRGYAIGPVYRGDTWAGGVLDLAGIELVVLLDGGGQKRVRERSVDQFHRLVYRPGAISIESRTRTAEITLHWRNSIPSERVAYRYM